MVVLSTGGSIRRLRRAVFLVIVALLLFPTMVSALAAGARADREQAILAGYRNAQQNPAMSQEDRIRAAVDTYFLLKWNGHVLSRVLDIGPVVDTSTLSGQALLEYEQQRLKYYLKCWALAGSRYADPRFAPQYERIDVQGATATVEIIPTVTMAIVGSPGAEVVFGDETHTLNLHSCPDGWKVVADDYTNEWILIDPPGTDFAAREASVERYYSGLEGAWHQFRQEHAEDPRFLNRLGDERDLSGGLGVLGYYEYIDTGRVTWYGTTYTSNEQTTGSYNLTRFAVAEGGDCQNFVSQCIWYGFGGINIHDEIEKRQNPMVYDVAGASPWWGTKHQGFSSSWISVSAFKSMARGNYTNDKIGVQSYLGSMAGIMVGDVVALSDWSHVWIVVGATDNDPANGICDYAEIFCSAHTTNRNNVQLCSLYPNPTSVRFMWTVWYKNP